MEMGTTDPTTTQYRLDLEELLKDKTLTDDDLKIDSMLKLRKKYHEGRFPDPSQVMFDDLDGDCECSQEHHGVSAVKVDTTRQTLTKEGILQCQEEDPILKEVKDWVRKEERPVSLQVIGAPKELVALYKQFKRLLIEDDLLKKRWTDQKSEEERNLVIIPEKMREEVMRTAHSSLLTAHPGVDKTIDVCLRQYYWPGMREEVKLYIGACLTCAGIKQPQAYLRAPLKHMIYHNFNDAVSIDHIVPKLEGRTADGNRYILSITDMWSGFVVAIPCKTQSAEESIRLIMRHYVLIHGVPKMLHSDNAKCFVSTFFTAVCRAFGCKTVTGLPYSCRSTSKAERTNKRLNQGLRAALQNHQLNKWDKYLPYVVFALNMLKSRHTGYTANRLALGREVNTPLSLIVENEPSECTFEGCQGDQYSYRKKAYLQHLEAKRIMYRVRKNAFTDFGYADNEWNKKVRGPFFKVGELCLVVMRKPPHKFSYRWLGPYKITKVLSEHTYVIQTPEGKQTYSLDKLKHFKELNKAREDDQTGLTEQTGLTGQGLEDVQGETDDEPEDEMTARKRTGLTDEPREKGYFRENSETSPSEGGDNEQTVLTGLTGLTGQADQGLEESGSTDDTGDQEGTRPDDEPAEMTGQKRTRLTDDTREQEEIGKEEDLRIEGDKKEISETRTSDGGEYDQEGPTGLTGLTEQTGRTGLTGPTIHDHPLDTTELEDLLGSSLLEDEERPMRRTRGVVGCYNEKEMQKRAWKTASEGQ